MASHYFSLWEDNDYYFEPQIGSAYRTAHLFFFAAFPEHDKDRDKARMFWLYNFGWRIEEITKQEMIDFIDGVVEGEEDNAYS